MADERRVSTLGIYIIDATPVRRASTFGRYIIHGPNQRRVSTLGRYIIEPEGPPDQRPTPPTLTHSAVTATGATIHRTPGTDPEGDPITATRLQVATDPAFGAGSIVYDSGPVGEAPFTVKPLSGLTGGTTYYYRGADGDAGGLGAWSDTESFATPAPVEPVVAAFTFERSGRAVTFADTSTGPVSSWLWNFGDGTTSTDQHPTHTYAASGSYTVTLTVESAEGATSSASATVAMGARRYRLEAWSRTGDKRRAIFGTLHKAERRQVLQGEETLAAEVSAQDGAAASLTKGAVLRLQREGSASDFTLWRLTGRQKARSQQDALAARITADALWMDLRQGMVRQKLVDGRAQYTFGLNGLTPTEWLRDFILPGYEGDAIGFQLGVVEGTINVPVNLSFERTSPLAALRMLEGAVQGATNGSGEAQFRLDPSGTFYYVDFLARVGATQGTAELRYAKNIVGLERLEDEVDVETRIYAAGSGLLTLADAEWQVAHVQGSTAALSLSIVAPHPVHETDAFVGLRFEIAGKGRYPITGSTRGPTVGVLVVDATDLPAPVVGDVGHLVTDAQGTRLAYLESPAGRADYAVRVGDYVAEDVPDAVNQVPNPDLSEWSGGLPVGWTLLGTPLVIETTDRLYAQQGERAARIVATEGDHGLLSPVFVLSNPVDRPYTGLLAGLTLLSGAVRVELRRVGGDTYPIKERPVLVDLGVYSTMTAGPVHDEPLPAGTYQVAVIAHGGAADWVLDCAMVTPQIGGEVPAFVSGSGAHLLWQRTAAELADRRLPRVEYRATVADLYRADPDTYRFDELRLGDSIPLRDPEFPRERIRVVELTQDVLRAEATNLVLAESARRRVHDPYRPPPPPLGGSRPGIERETAGSETPTVHHVPRQWDALTEALTLGAIGNATVATLELRTKAQAGDPWPLAPASTIAGRQGWFSPLPVAEDEVLHYQVTPKDGRGVPGDAVEDTWARTSGAQGPPGPPGGPGPEGRPGSANLLPVGAGAERAFAGVVGTLYEAQDLTVVLSERGLVADDVVSASVRARNTVNGNVQLGLLWIDSGGNWLHITWGGEFFVTGLHSIVTVLGAVVPATAHLVRPVIRRTTSIDGTAVCYGDRWMLARGPEAMPFEEPSWKPGANPQLPPGTTLPTSRAIIKQIAHGIWRGEGRDEFPDNQITFPERFTKEPVFVPISGGITYHPDLASMPHGQFVDALNLSTTSFVLSAKIRGVSGTPEPRHRDFVASGGYPESQVVKSHALEAFDKRYTFRFSLELLSHTIGGETRGSEAAVTFWYNTGSGWESAGSVNYSNYSGENKVWSALQQTYSITGLGAGASFGISAAITGYSGALTAQRVDWTEVAAPIERTATPDGAPNIQFLIIGGT